MKKILVAIDIARTGGNETVINTALDIARTMDGTLVFLHVIEPTPGYVLSEVPEGILANRKDEAEAKLKEMTDNLYGAEAVVREGPPATEILDYAARIKADLIVVHSHDPGLSDYFLGSVASRIVRHAHCSVYVVRHPDNHA